MLKRTTLSSMTTMMKRWISLLRLSKLNQRTLILFWNGTVEQQHALMAWSISSLTNHVCLDVLYTRNSESIKKHHQMLLLLSKCWKKRKALELSWLVLTCKMGKTTMQEQHQLLEQFSALYRIILHHLKRYAEAQRHFEASESMNPKEKTLATWLRKNAEKIPKGKKRLHGTWCETWQTPDVYFYQAEPALPAPVAAPLLPTTPSQARVRWLGTHPATPQRLTPC